jgi:drug/metabolite transporter (DMT)-like permease
MPSQLIPVSFSLAAVFSWGTSDFVGGYAARRVNAFLFTSLAHASGLIMMTALALINGSPFPSRSGVAWALAAGAIGGLALAIFYQALATGKMGLTAPVGALLGAAIPTVFTITTEGLPGAMPIIGFVLAGAGIWLISRPDGDAGCPEGLGLAALAGVGFAGFYLCVKQAGDSSALWTAALARGASFVATITVVLIGRHFRDMTTGGVALSVVAGCLDVGGSALFVRARQTGRLDAAVVISSLYPAITVLLARIILREHFTRWKTIGMFAALLAVPMIAWQ